MQVSTCRRRRGDPVGGLPGHRARRAPRG